jgi:hypothetical protein
MPNRVKFFLFCLILMSGIFAPPGFAAPRLTVEAPARQISTEQSATLTVRLDWPQAEDPYEINSLEPKLENLTLEKQDQSQETGAMVRHTLTYEFRPVKKGTAVIYAFEIDYRKSDTEPWIPILVPEQKIRVVASFPFKTILIWLAVLGGTAALTVGGIGVGRILNNRRAAMLTTPPDPKQRIYAKAEEAIATFASSDPKEKLTHWSNQLRTVIVTYYELPSTTATSSEILSSLKDKGLLAGEWNEVSRIFQQLKEMQFSRADIPARDLEQLQKTLLQYVKGKIIIGTSNS